MLISTTLSFVLLIVSGIALETVIRRRKKSTNQNPQFWAFQKTYLATQIVLLLADWLQAPYNYKVGTQPLSNSHIPKLDQSMHFSLNENEINRVPYHCFVVVFFVWLYARTNRGHFRPRSCGVDFVDAFCQLCRRLVWTPVAHFLINRF